MKRSFFVIVLSSLVLFSCNQENNTENNDTNIAEDTTATADSGEGETEATENTLDKDLQYKLDIIISNNMLVPVTIISDLKKDGKSLYHPEYINSLDNVSNYTDDFYKAVNFGIYGVDIIYNIAHDHSEEISDYRDKTLDMAKSLGLESFYVEEDMKKFQEAVKDDQKVSQFIFDEYHKIDEYLVSHDRFETATLMLTGGIIESMFFTGKSIEEYGLSDLKYRLLLNEKQTMEQLIELLGYFKGNEQDEKLKAELEKLHESFSSFSSKEELTAEKIKSLDDQVIELRNKLVETRL